VSAYDHHAGLQRFFRAAAQDLAAEFGRQIGREGSNVQSQERLPSHRIHVREAVGGCDGAELVGRIHHGSEEIRGHHQGARVVHAPDRCVVRVAEADQEVRVVTGVEYTLNWTQYLRQRFRIQFRRSTRAAREAGQAYLAAGWFGWLHIVPLLLISAN